MGKFSYVLKNTVLNMRRSPLLVFATIIAVLVSSFLVFTTLSARSIVQNNTLRWQSGVHVVVFLDDRVTTTAHKQLQESLESYPEVRLVDYFSKSEAKDEFKALFKDQPELLAEVDYELRNHVNAIHYKYRKEMRDKGLTVQKDDVVQYVNNLHPSQLMFALNFKRRKINHEEKEKVCEI